MPTKDEIKEIERVIGKPISEIDELSIPTFIRNQDAEKEQFLVEEVEREEFLRNNY